MSNAFFSSPEAHKGYKPQPISPRVSQFINLSRWSAALVVVIAHTRQIIMCDYTKVIDKNILIRFLYFVTQLGHEAVMVFFVISGYLVGGNAVVKIANGFDAKVYAVDRFSRIYTAYLPALMIGGILDIIRMKYLPTLHLSIGEITISSIKYSATTPIELRDLIGNLFMTQTIFVPPLGTNGPLWSLANEWWYYCLFGLAMVVATGRTLAIRLIILIMLISLIVIMPGGIIYWGSIWLLGIIARIYARNRSAFPPFAVTIPLAILWSILARFSHASDMEISSIGRFFIDFGTGSVYCAVLLSAHREGKDIVFSSVNSSFADFSYSLYLIHFPIMVFVVALLYRFGFGIVAQPSAGSTIYLLAMIASLVFCGFVFSLFTEQKTRNVRRFILDAVNAYGARRPMPNDGSGRNDSQRHG